MNFIIVLLIILNFSGVTVSATEFGIIGTRPLGMGGAYVGYAADGIGAYYNPAGFALQKRFDLEIPVMARIMAPNNFIKEVNDIASLDFDAIEAAINNNTVTEASVKEFFKLLDEIQDLTPAGAGITFDASAGLSFRVKNMGVNLLGYLRTAGDPDLDLENLNLAGVGSEVTAAESFMPAGEQVPTAANQGLANDLAVQYPNLGRDSRYTAQQVANTLVYYAEQAGLTGAALTETTTQVAKILDSLAGGGSFKDNNTTVTLKGLYVKEAIFTFARKLRNYKSLYGGINVKVMEGETVYVNQRVFDSDDIEKDVKNAFDWATCKSTTFGLDLGLILKKGFTRLGLVVKNVNAPTFDYAGPGKMRLDCQVRAGVALRPSKRTLLCADLDITKNKSLIDGHESQILAVGAEFQPFGSALFRLGAYQNLADSDDDLVYTAGFGIRAFHFRLDLAAALSGTKSLTEAGDIPSEGRLAVQLSFDF